MGVPAVMLRTSRAPRVAYRVALDVLLKGGFQVETRALDELLLTTPRGTAIRVEVVRNRDSTEVIVTAVELQDDGQSRCETCLQRELLTAAMVLNRIKDGLRAWRAPPGTRGDSLAAAGAFGYAPRNPIRVGGGRENGVRNEHAYLDALRGPRGERVTYVRLGSCCEFRTPNPLAEEGTGLLDAFEVTYPGLRKPVVLYLNLYDPPRGSTVPAGFTRATPTPAPPRP